MENKLLEFKTCHTESQLVIRKTQLLFAGKRNHSHTKATFFNMFYFSKER